MIVELIIAIFLFLLLVFLATIDIAFSYLSDVTLRRLSGDSEDAQRTSGQNFLTVILADRGRFRFTISTTIQILLVSFTAIVAIIISQLLAPAWVEMFAYTLLLAVVATVLGRQIIPRLIVNSNTESKLMALLPIVRPLYSVVSIVTSPFSFTVVGKEDGRIDVTMIPDSVTDDDEGEANADDLQALIEVGEAEGIIEEKDREMIETMVGFADTRVGTIMTPRTEVVGVSVGTLIKDARDIIIEEKLSRLPVYRENIDSIEGILYVRDLLAALATGRKEEPVESIMREAFFVPETKTADELLKSMQREHVQIAIVIDEYGGVAGVVTIEDILEEIVGEIEDEDTEEEEIVEIIEGEDGYYDVLGSTEIDKIERLIGTDLEDEEYSTIAGLVTSEAGHVPKIGDVLTIKGIDIKILEADEKRVQKLRIRAATENAALTPFDLSE